MTSNLLLARQIVGLVQSEDSTENAIKIVEEMLGEILEGKRTIVEEELALVIMRIRKNG